MAASASPTLRTRPRASASNQRLTDRKNTNMTTESKYTSAPPIRVIHTLAPPARVSAIATGRSMPGRPWRRPRQAPRKNGVPAYSSTGSATSMLIRRRKSRMAGSSVSPAR